MRTSSPVDFKGDFDFSIASFKSETGELEVCRRGRACSSVEETQDSPVLTTQRYQIVMKTEPVVNCLFDFRLPDLDFEVTCARDDFRLRSPMHTRRLLNTGYLPRVPYSAA